MKNKPITFRSHCNKRAKQRELSDYLKEEFIRSSTFIRDVSINRSHAHIRQYKDVAYVIAEKEHRYEVKTIYPISFVN